MTGPPTTAAGTFWHHYANYNPAADPGGLGRRWGDYSYTVVDPLDDMTVYTVQEYNRALNSYAVRVGKLAAPLPATPTCAGSPITFTGPTGNVVINAYVQRRFGFLRSRRQLAAAVLPSITSARPSPTRLSTASPGARQRRSRSTSRRWPPVR